MRASDTVSAGATEFASALRQFLDDWPQVDTVAATFRLPGGSMLTVRLAGPVLELEDDMGNSLIVPQQNDPAI